MSRRAKRAFKNSTAGRAVFERAALQAEEGAKVQGCQTGKKIIKKKEHALAAARKLTARHGLPHRAYRCRTCRHFHLTTRGSGTNPDTGKRENPAKTAKAPPLNSLVGCTVKRLVKSEG